jgi:hypothetical protein
LGYDNLQLFYQGSKSVSFIPKSTEVRIFSCINFHVNA